MNHISHYCQNCGTANTIGEDACMKCGTRLMIITFPNSYRFDDSVEPSYYEHFLLEKIGLLELRLSQMADQFSRVINVLERQNDVIERQNSNIEIIKNLANDTFSELLNDINEKITTKKSKTKEAKTNLFGEIFENYEGERRELFEKMISDGIDLLSQREEKQALRMFQQAQSLSNQNIPLLTFIGKTLFELDKFAEAEKHLENALKIAPNDEKLLLLSSIIYANNGEILLAKNNLKMFVGLNSANFMANYVFGFLESSEGNWKKSLSYFKDCLKIEKTIEIEYLIACVYFQLKDFNNSLKFANKCCEKEDNFADAWFLQSMIYAKLKDSEKSLEMLDKAKQTKDLDAQCILFFNKKDSNKEQNALPFSGFTKSKKQILTNGSRRLVRFFQSKLNEAIS
jgi:tetratricopeptide (TPR) repeat protein